MAGIDFIHQNGTDYEIVPEIAPLFKTTQNYTAGQHVIYNAALYTFKEDKSAGAWDATKVNGPFEVAKQISDLKEDLNAIGGTALYGKRVSILGDSISTYSGYLTPNSNTAYYPSCQGSPNADITSVDETWWKIVIDKAKMELGVNNSYSGRTLIESATTANVKALDDNGTPDIIIVYLGTNDANQQVTLGQIDKTIPFNADPSETYGETLGTNLTEAQVEALTTTDFYTAVRTLIIRLQWYYPNAKIVFLTIGWGSYDRFYADNPYRQALIDCCELMGVDTIDMRKSGIHMPKLTEYTLQRVHPNKKGMACIGNYVYNKLVSLFGARDEQRTVKLDSITYSGTLTKTAYHSGDSFNPDGLTFTASYTDGTSHTVDVSDIAFTPDPLTTGTTSVTASYTSGDITKSCSITGITVTDIQTITTSANYKFDVYDSLDDLTFKANGSIKGINNQIGRAYYEAPNNGRAAPFIAGSATSPNINGELISVSGGETITFTVPSGFTDLQWTLFELGENATIISGAKCADSWLTGSYTLLSDTRYILIAFKVDGGTGTPSEAQLASLKNALSISA